MNQQTKVSVISGLVMILIIFLLTYYGYPSKTTQQRSDKSRSGSNQNLVHVKSSPTNQYAEGTPCCFKTNNNANGSFNIFGPPAKIELPEKMNDHLRVSDLDLAVN